MLDMGKKTPPPPPDPEETGRTGENLNVWVHRDLVKALRDCVQATRPRTTKTAIVEEALESYLAGRGFWPLSEDE